MSRQARFEVVRTDDGWHGRFRAANGRVVWTTEVYTRKAKAEAAIRLLVDAVDWFPDTTPIRVFARVKDAVIAEHETPAGGQTPTDLLPGGSEAEVAAVPPAGSLRDERTP